MVFGTVRIGYVFVERFRDMNVLILTILMEEKVKSKGQDEDYENDDKDGDWLINWLIDFLRHTDSIKVIWRQ